MLPSPAGSSGVVPGQDVSRFTWPHGTAAKGQGRGQLATAMCVCVKVQEKKKNERERVCEIGREEGHLQLT